MPCGVVKEVKESTVVVTMERQDMCGDCHACEMISGKKSCTLNCETQIPCQVGDKVEVGLTSDYFLKATYLIYGVPLIGFLIGLLIGISATKYIEVAYTDLILVGCIAVGTGLGVLYIKKRDKKKAYNQYLPHITKVYSELDTVLKQD